MLGTEYTSRNRLLLTGTPLQVRARAWRARLVCLPSPGSKQRSIRG